MMSACIACIGTHCKFVVCLGTFGLNTYRPMAPGESGKHRFHI